jgi:DNA modification methylase
MTPTIYTIYTGNCLAWLRSLADKSVDVCIMDPPYSEHVHTRSLRSRKGGTKGPLVSRELGFAHIDPKLQRKVSAEVARVTRRWVLAFCTPEMLGGWRADLEHFKLQHVRVGVWVKPNGAPQFGGDRPGTGWEAIEIAHPKGRKRWNGGGHHAVWTHSIETGQYKGDRVHSTEKPIGLMLELVSLFSDPGELVIDPFAGSGTTGVACVRLGRRFAGAELDPTMAQHATDRLEAERCNLTVRSRRLKQEPLFPGVNALGVAV